MSVTTILRSRWTGTLVMGLLGLSVAILAALLLPGRAEAQQEPAATNWTMVVGSGDSLWTIAKTRLGPDASPQQVAAETERIYGLNRDRIGDDPNTVQVGQELLVSPIADPMVVGGEELHVRVEPAAASNLASSAEQPADQEVPAGAPAEGNEEPAAESPAETAAEPAEEPAEEPAAKVAAEPAAEDEPATFGPEDVGERRILGVAILLLTVVVAIIMVRRLPLNRSRRGLSPYHPEGNRRYSDNYALPGHQEREQTEEEGEEQTTEVAAPEQAEVEKTTAANSAGSATTVRDGSREHGSFRRIRVDQTSRGR